MKLLKVILGAGLFHLAAACVVAETTTLRIDSFSEHQSSPDYRHEVEIMEMGPFTTGSAFDQSNFFAVEEGREYSVTARLVGTNTGFGGGDHTISLHFHVPAGYTTRIDSYEASYYAANGEADTFTLTVVRQSSLALGQASRPQLELNQFSMDFGVARLPNGRVLPAARLRADISGDVDDILEISNFNFSRPYGLVWYYTASTAQAD